MYSAAVKIKKIKGNIATVGFRNSEEKDNVEVSFDPQTQNLKEGEIVSVIPSELGAKIKFQVCGEAIENPGPGWKK